MKKILGIVFILTVLLATNANATPVGTRPVPDAGSTSMLLFASIAGLATLRKFMR